MSSAPPEITTLGELKASRYRMRSVKDEMRENLIRSLKEKRNVFEGILGYDESVIPQIHNAILGRHDMILLGLRGQAKSRVIRMLPNLLDDYIPIIDGSDVNDDPFAPISKYGRDLVTTHGDDTPISWLARSERYGEKLATPDTTMADLIGDIDPIKAAHRKLTYADEEVIHFGIIPRTNRGIFAINELPDLQPRIQVGLLNVLEEQDIQIRGFHVRFPLDLMMVFTANPEDYTNRGNIITGRDREIEDILLTLCKRSKRGTILVGEPGVGKTAIVNAINARLIQRTVPRQLVGCQVFNLDVPYVFSKYKEDPIGTIIKVLERASE